MDNIITDISYTSKDFQSIYPELLDLVKKLTNKWDPSLSNESDPGVILLKLNALIADKNNYNIDKNVLECFPQSVTQYGNARKLYDLLGYNMNHYISAVTKVQFRLKSNNDLNTLINPVKIEQFKQLTDDSGKLSWILLQDVQLINKIIDGNNNVINVGNVVNAVEAAVMQGRIKDYTINGNHIIYLNNLDNNLRLYFDEKQIAQNGIFIKGQDVEGQYIIPGTNLTDGLSTGWTRVDNLAAYPPNMKIYQFGILPNSNTCYIQFPKDIANLIGSGLNIKYIISDGLEGNISKNILTKFVDNLVFKNDNDTTSIINDKIIIKQPNSTNNGKNPESLDEAYFNYKKTVGTFDTLITKRDFENFIYNLKVDNSSLPLVSNLRVSDRTNDLNDSHYVQTRQGMSILKKELVTTFKDINNLKLYMLNTSNVEDFDSYKNCFKYPNNASSLLNNDIEPTLAEIKSLPANLKLLDQNDTVIYLNNYALKGSVLTYYKATSAEKKEIEDNIRNALYIKYQPHNLEYGKELDYNDLISTIKSADIRIKTVILDTPTISETTAIDASNNPKNINPNDLIAKTVLSGNLQLYNFLDNLNMQFGQSRISDITYDANTLPYIAGNIKSITSIAKYPLLSYNKDNFDENSYELKLNENLYVLKPVMNTVTEYVAPVKYIFTLTKAIHYNENYTLGENETLTLEYKESANNLNTKKDTYTQGTIISFNSPDKTSTDTIATGANGTLFTNQTIDIKKLNKSELNYNSDIQYLAVLDKKRFEANSNTYNLTEPIILSDNEWFLERSTLTNELIFYGVGTRISSNNTINNFADKINIDLNTIDEDKLLKLDWNTIDDVDQVLTVQEMNVTILTAGTRVAAYTSKIFKDNKYQDDLEIIYYKLPSDSKIYSISADTNDKIYARSALNINFNNKEQKLEVGQSIELTMEDGTTKIPIDGSENTYIQFNYPLISAGADDIDLSTYNEDTEEYEYLYRCYAYNYIPNNAITSDPAGSIIISTENDLTIIKQAPGKTVNKIVCAYPFKYNAPTYEYIIPVQFKSTDTTKYIELTNATVLNPIKFNDVTDDNSIIIRAQTDYCYYILPNDYGFIFKNLNLSASDEIIIGKIEKRNGLNIKDINSTNPLYEIETNLTEVEKIIKENNTFNWTYKVNDINKVTQPLTAKAFWNTNHLANSYTLPKLSSIDITVNSSSLK